MRKTEGKPIPRGSSPPPCDTSIGCAKGHWRDEARTKLTPAEESVIAAYRGGTLTEQEKRDPIVRKVLGALAEISARFERESLSNAIALAVIRSASK